jgi:hypothetical protein
MVVIVYLCGPCPQGPCEPRPDRPVGVPFGCAVWAVRARSEGHVLSTLTTSGGGRGPAGVITLALLVPARVAGQSLSCTPYPRP